MEKNSGLSSEINNLHIFVNCAFNQFILNGDEVSKLNRMYNNGQKPCCLTEAREYDGSCRLSHFYNLIALDHAAN